MKEAHELIAVFHELNNSNGRTIANMAPSLIGLFGSLRLFDAFLTDLDTALVNNAISEPLRKRAANLAGTFIPQVAGYNSINELPPNRISPEQLRSLRADSPENRQEGVTIILTALMNILTEFNRT
jgi:hypothetical protein